MSHIFVSYSSKDRDFVLELVQSLNQFFDVWVDLDGIKGGMEWKEKIEEALTECTLFMVVVTPESDESDWVTREILLAENLNKPRIPIMLKGERLPFELLNLHFIDFRGEFEGGFRDLLEATQKHLQPQNKTQNYVNTLIGQAIRARIAQDYTAADNVIGQVLAIQPDLAQSISSFWSQVGARSNGVDNEWLRTYIAGGAAIIIEETKQLNDRRYGKNTAYEWRISVDLPDDALDKIESVQYTLHETFTNPVRIIRDRASKFSLTMIGWGIFEIPVELRLKDGSTVRTSYHLRFDID